MDQWRGTPILVRQVVNSSSVGPRGHFTGLACCLECVAQQRNSLQVKSCANIIQWQVEDSLQIAVKLVSLQVSGPPVQRVQGQRAGYQDASLGCSSELSQDNRFEVASAGVVGIE